MSFTPKIVVDYNDLKKLFKAMPDLLDFSDKALKFIYESYVDKYAGTSDLKGIKIMILEPEFTEFNENVRLWLFDIEYCLV